MGNIFSRISREACVVLFLTFSVIIVYFPVGSYPFVLLDDDKYVYENTVVKNGISVAGIKWAFLSNDPNHVYWHPITWLSLMSDVEIFGVNPSGHHLINVLLHLANCLLLFFLIKNITGCIWRSAFVAILFALHPINIESVAWIS
ncbi:MAG: hypothetical protein KAR13_11540, partial [Desulfobulbaceae bacterium]|nr:hypothetical protein [Desulfobulbaceae bacterium]